MKAVIFPHRQSHRGFTLTELLVVVTILVVLGLAVLIGLDPMTQLFKGYDARRKDDLHKIKNALESYYADHDCYPLFPLKDATNHPSYACGSDFLKPYLLSMPCDPNSGLPYKIYLSPSDSKCPQKFSVYAQIYAFFDKNANLIPFCENTYAVGSPDMSYGQMSVGCAEIEICANHYGCKNGICKWLSGYELPACTPVFCTDTCGQDSAENALIYCQRPDNSCQ